jgi:predicted MPP superfamily phosphohydrolase
MRGFAGAFASVRGRHGTLSVPGNHEYLAGFDLAAREIRGAGIPLLRGEHRTIERSGDTLTILGLDDPGGATFDPPQDEAVSALAAQVPAGQFAILLAHRPAAFDAAARLGIPLTLAGHTHGGQIGLPARDLTPVRLLTRYVRGHYERGDSHLIVSSGVGTVDLPLRLGVPPSVALITLEKA